LIDDELELDVELVVEAVVVVSADRDESEPLGGFFETLGRGGSSTTLSQLAERSSLTAG
jgi:hypothetical protein